MDLNVAGHGTYKLFYAESINYWDAQSRCSGVGMTLATILSNAHGDALHNALRWAANGNRHMVCPLVCGSIMS